MLSTTHRRGKQGDFPVGNVFNMIRAALQGLIYFVDKTKSADIQSILLDDRNKLVHDGVFLDAILKAPTPIQAEGFDDTKHEIKEYRKQLSERVGVVGKGKSQDKPPTSSDGKGKSQAKQSVSSDKLRESLKELVKKLKEKNFVTSVSPEVVQAIVDGYASISKSSPAANPPPPSAGVSTPKPLNRGGVADSPPQVVRT